MTTRDSLAALIDALAEAIVEEYLTSATKPSAANDGARAERPVDSLDKAA